MSCCQGCLFSMMSALKKLSPTAKLHWHVSHTQHREPDKLHGEWWYASLAYLTALPVCVVTAIQKRPIDPGVSLPHGERPNGPEAPYMMALQVEVKFRGVHDLTVDNGAGAAVALCVRVPIGCFIIEILGPTYASTYAPTWPQLEPS
ncbi:hypothetical protein C8R44DRAFT_850080 [Mycena epipterygia]|nr:hypothetical protein C8R44DRAFT_850080 [Mycena epipterygia]